MRRAVVPRAVLPCAALLLAVLGGVSACGTAGAPGGSGTRTDGSASAASPSTGSPAPGGPVVSDTAGRPVEVVRAGDLVTGSGVLTARPDGTVRFCPPVPVPAMAYPPGEKPPYPCDGGRDVIGLDPSAVRGERVRDGGIEAPSARLTARLLPDGRLRVDPGNPEPPAPRPGAGGEGFLDRPSCPEPPGGWPLQKTDQHDNVDDRAVTAYVRANPGVVDEWLQLNPSRRQHLLLVLTTGDPAPVKRALRPAYGDSLCVERVRWTRAEVAAAIRELGPGAERFHDRSGQPVVEFPLPHLSAVEAERIARLPTGLVVVAPWLRRVA